jgi:hypothetical protein
MAQQVGCYKIKYLKLENTGLQAYFIFSETSKDLTDRTQTTIIWHFVVKLVLLLSMTPDTMTTQQMTWINYTNFVIGRGDYKVHRNQKNYAPSKEIFYMHISEKCNSRFSTSQN